MPKVTAEHRSCRFLGFSLKAPKYFWSLTLVRGRCVGGGTSRASSKIFSGVLRGLISRALEQESYLRRLQERRHTLTPLRREIESKRKLPHQYSRQKTRKSAQPIFSYDRVPVVSWPRPSPGQISW